MTIKINATGAERKRLVQTISDYQQELLYHKTGCASITFFQFRCIFCSGDRKSVV